MSDIQKSSVFTQALANKRSQLAGGGEESCTVLKKVTHTWTNLVDKFLALMGGNKKCTVICTGDISKHLEKDGDGLVKAIVQQRKEVCRLMNQLDQFKEDYCTKVPAALSEFLSDPVPGAFQSEFSSEAFDDIVAKHAANLLNSLLSKKMEFEAGLQKFYLERQMDAEINHFDRAKKWMEGLDEHCSFADILEKSKMIIQTVPAKTLKPFTQQVSQDRT